MATNKKILLVEDDTNLGNLLQDSLELKNYDVVLKRNGDDAFTEFKANKFDMCLLDVMMPKKDGFTLAKDIRRMNTNIPIIFLTAKALKEDTIEGLKLGADDYLAKPFNLEELLLRVGILLKRPKTLQEKELTVYTFGNNQINFITYEIIGVDNKKIQISKKEIKSGRYK